MAATANHASIDRSSRLKKAEKILRLLRLSDHGCGGLKVLEIGCGSGVIACHLALQRAPTLAVWAVDVVDQRIDTAGYRFQLVDGVGLPFCDGFFDVIISNHVIEHVGDPRQQRLHLAEIKRLLAAGGQAYLAMPNRWMIVEPHFGVAFLSWLPEGLRSPYLKFRLNRAVKYDCRPLSPRSIERMFRDVGLRFESMFVPALSDIVEREPYKYKIFVPLLKLPKPLLCILGRFSPTLIYRLLR
jgi:SAM-dependent methyltransferase